MGWIVTEPPNGAVQPTAARRGQPNGATGGPAGQPAQRPSQRGARIVSVCTGAFALAAAGLLDGRRATTHWSEAETLAREHPEVDVDPNVLYVDNGDIATSAGAAAGIIDLCLHVVRLATGTTPYEWLVVERIRLAQHLLETTDRSIDFIAADAGFGTVTNMRQHLQRTLAVSPARYRTAFHQGRVA